MSGPDKFIRKHDLPRGIIRVCTLCGHAETTLKLPPGAAGRGWGMREGNKQRGRIIQHIKSAHPEVGR